MLSLQNEMCFTLRGNTAWYLNKQQYKYQIDILFENTCIS